MGRVITLDALGTLVALEDPGAAARRRAGPRAAWRSSEAQAARGAARGDRVLPRPPRQRRSTPPRSRGCGRAAPRCCGRRSSGAGADVGARSRRPRWSTRCWRRCASRRSPTCPARWRELRAAGPSPRRRLQLGRVAARDAAHDRPRRARRRRDQLGRGGRAQAGAGDLPRARSRWRGAPRRATARAGAARRRLARARRRGRARGRADAVLVARDGVVPTGARRRGGARLARRARRARVRNLGRPCPTSRPSFSPTCRAADAGAARRPGRPAAPDAAALEPHEQSGRDRWPPWLSIAGFAAGYGDDDRARALRHRHRRRVRRVDEGPAAGREHRPDGRPERSRSSARRTSSPCSAAAPPPPTSACAPAPLWRSVRLLVARLDRLLRARARSGRVALELDEQQTLPDELGANGLAAQRARRRSCSSP